MEQLNGTIIETPVTVRLHEADHEKVNSTGQDFSQVASFLVEQYSRGGVMLKPSQAHYLSTLSGTIVKTAEDVITVVENGVNRHSASGNLVVTYSLDPAYAEPMEELAQQQGRTVEEIVQEAISVVFTNSWLYSISVEGGTLNFTREDREELERIVGHRPVTGSSLLGFLRRAGDPPSQPRISKALQQVRAKMDQEEVVV